MERGDMVMQIGNTVTFMISSIENIYKDHGYKIQFPKQFIRTSIMAMVSPFTLKLRENLDTWVVAQPSKPSSQLRNHDDSSEDMAIRKIKAKPIRKEKNKETDGEGFKKSRDACVLHPDFERKLVKWIIQKKQEGVLLTNKDVITHALSIRPYDSFKASRGWLKKFAYRNPVVKNAIRQFIPCQIFGSLDSLDEIEQREYISESE